MGLRNALRLAQPATAAQAARGIPPLQLQSPWAQPSTLTSLVIAELGLDLENLPLDRAQAMTVPAMSRSRHLLAGSIASCPLIKFVGNTQVEAPAWATRTDCPQSPYQRMLWTVDDLVFYGWSVWHTPRGSDLQPITAQRVPADQWLFDHDGVTVIDADTRIPLAADSHTIIPGPHEGLLSFGARTLRTAVRFERTIARHAAQPVPAIDLHQTEDVELTDTERDQMVQKWVKARQSDYGSVAFTSYGVEARALGEVPEALLIDGRNAQAVDVARHTSIPASLIDATSAGASLTYETTQARNTQFLDYGASLYLDPIAAQLSQDSMTPRGSRIGFDTSQLTAVSRANTETEPAPAPTQLTEQA
jgi:hypothetical protein